MKWIILKILWEWCLDFSSSFFGMIMEMILSLRISNQIKEMVKIQLDLKNKVREMQIDWAKEEIGNFWIWDWMVCRMEILRFYWIRSKNRLRVKMWMLYGTLLTIYMRSIKQDQKKSIRNMWILECRTRRL